MKLTGTVVAVSAFGVGAFGTEMAAGAPGAAAKPATLHGTFERYAHVDQPGDLGSHVGATGLERRHRTPVGTPC